MSGWCGSGGSALATALERTNAAAQPTIAAPWRVSLNFISTPLRHRINTAIPSDDQNLSMSRGDEAIFYDAADWRCQLRHVPGAKKACRSRPDRRESGPGCPRSLRSRPTRRTWCGDRFPVRFHYRREGHQDRLDDRRKRNQLWSVRVCTRRAENCRHSAHVRDGISSGSRGTSSRPSA